MAEKEYNTTAGKYQHLSLDERGEIKALLREGLGVTAIAGKIGRDKSTVSREIKRGSVTQMNSELVKRQEYFADAGERVYRENRRRSRNALKLAECAAFLEYADKKMKEGWSPDAVCGRAKANKDEGNGPLVCAKTLYNYVDLGLMVTKNIDLALKVRRKPKTKKVRQHKKILGESIESRPEQVAAREEFGHWEIDSVIGKKADETAVMTLVERKTRNQIAVKLPARGSNAVDAEMQEIYASFGSQAQEIFKSVTGDNGAEFAGLKDAIACAVYFCHPYSSWEKGTNERHNGLLRRFVKKGMSIDAMPPQAIVAAAAWNNNLPRKILGYRTPAEFFADEVRKTHGLMTA